MSLLLKTSLGACKLEEVRYVFNAHRQEFLLAPLFDCRSMWGRDAGINWAQLRERPGNDGVRAQRDQGGATVRTKRHKDVDAIRELPKGVRERESGQCIAPAAIDEKVEEGNLVDLAEMLREEWQDVIADLDF